MRKSVTITAACITGAAVIVAAVIGLLNQSSKSLLTTATGNISPLLFGSQVGRDLTLTVYNLPGTATKDAIKQLESKLNQTDDKVELTMNELHLLTQSLKDLDQRTSAIQKLPDGRTKVCSFISGISSIVIDEYNTSLANFNSGDYYSSLTHSQNAIKAYEDTQEIIKGMKVRTSTGDLKPETVSMVYVLGAMSVQRLGEKHVAYQYARKAIEFSPSAINHAVLATTLYNLGKYQEALNNIEKAVQYAPHDSEFIELKTTISAACSKK